MSGRKDSKLTRHIGLRVSDADMKLIELAELETAVNRSELVQRLVRSFMPALVAELKRERDQRMAKLEAALKKEGVNFELK